MKLKAAQFSFAIRKEHYASTFQQSELSDECFVQLGLWHHVVLVSEATEGAQHHPQRSIVIDSFMHVESKGDCVDDEILESLFVLIQVKSVVTDPMGKYMAICCR